MIGVWINNGSGWNVESIELLPITYRALSESCYMDLLVELRSPRKGLINIKNKDQKCFSWCHLRHINSLKEHPEIIKKTDKKIAEKLDYDGTEFAVQEKDFNKIEVKNNICINVFSYENGLAFPIYFSDHYVYIKDFDRFVFRKAKNKNKNWFSRSCLQCFSGESVLIKHKKNCLNIIGQQSVKLEKGIIEFENYFKQIPVPFKIYTDFECNLRSVESYEGSYTKNYQDHIPSNFADKVICIDDRFTKPIVFIKAILKEHKYCKKVINKHFNKNFIMSEKEEHLFQQSNSCWICKKNLLIMMKKTLETIVT